MKEHFDRLANEKGLDLNEPFVDPKELKFMAFVINEVFEALILLFPAWQQTATPIGDMKTAWIDAFIRHEIKSSEQIKRGLEKCELSTSPFLPSVGQFIAWCKTIPEQMGFPDLEEAYQIACYNAKGYNIKKKPWKHNAVRYAAHLTGSHQLNSKTEYVTKPIFQKHYEKIMQELASGMPEEEILPDYKTLDAQKIDLENPKLESPHSDLPCEPMTKEEFEAEKPFWKPGYVFKKYAHLTSAEKALPVIYKFLGVYEKKQQQAKDILDGKICKQEK